MSNAPAVDRAKQENGQNSSETSETRRLKEEIVRLREGLEGVLLILGNPAGYSENDRTEVAHAVAEAERALGRPNL